MKPSEQKIIEALRDLACAFEFASNKTDEQFDAMEKASLILGHFPAPQDKK